MDGKKDEKKKKLVGDKRSHRGLKKIGRPLGGGLATHWTIFGN